MANTAEALPALPGTAPLNETVDLARLTNTRWQEFLAAEIAAARTQRERRWSRDRSSAEAYAKSIEPNRERFRRAIGAIDSRVAQPRLELIAASPERGPWVETSSYEIWSVRWPAIAGVNGEGLLLRPKHAAAANVVFVPDADQLPEDAVGLRGGDGPMARAVRRLAASGACVVIPLLANRSARHSGDEALGVFTNQTQREWIYRQAAPTGRHIIGYEVEKTLAALDCLAADSPATPGGVVGYGEGGLLALYAAAIDSRIAATWIGGYFQPRETAWREPLYRSVWGLLREFGDAEIASLVAPRALVVELSRGPAMESSVVMTGPVAARSAAPGELRDATPTVIRNEWQRALTLVGLPLSQRFSLVGDGGDFGGEEAVRAFWHSLSPAPLAPAPASSASAIAPIEAALAAREWRNVRELQGHAQAQIRAAAVRREETFWSKLSPRDAKGWPTQAAPWRATLAREGIGELDTPAGPLAPRSRARSGPSNARWSAYDVMLDIAPGAVTWGCLLVPSDLRPDERRAVVVCQHGSGGLPADTFDESPAARAHQIYQAYAARLAARGYVVFAPYLPNRIGGDDYRLLARKANLLGLSLFSLTNASHARILEWLRSQPFVDPQRIALYGMSYGSKVAIRAAAALDGYAAVVCAGDFQDNVVSMSTVRFDRNECMFYPDYELVEWDLASRFDSAELVALIAPRPFMVEFGYADRAVQLEGAAAQLAKARQWYLRLGDPRRIAIEFFEGGHTVPGRGTFDFLDKWLRY